MINIETMERPVFGQIAQQVVEGRGDYDDFTRQRVMERIVREGPFVGRTAIVGLVHDGEVGPVVTSVPTRPRPVDPLAYGI